MQYSVVYCAVLQCVDANMDAKARRDRSISTLEAYQPLL